MNISRIRSITGRDRHRIVATVEWEDSPQQPMDLYFETTSERVAYLSARAEPFLLACLMPALYAKERRIGKEQGRDATGAGGFARE